jgi:putative ubiquitin-RnfH superfamily antitoxin RatB of RatAB toxin-antitoxin module
MVSVDVAVPQAGGMIRVVVSYSPAPRSVDVCELQLPVGSTLQQALEASGLVQRHGLVIDDQLAVGIWMKLRPLDSVLRSDDRVEIYRGLRVDPKEARRQRFRKQAPKPAQGRGRAPGEV